MKRAPIPKAESQGEALFALHCQVHKLTPVREYVFHPSRKWRLDFAWPELKFAVEIESSVHRIKNRFRSDLEKYNALIAGGWTLLRYTRRMVETGAPILEVEKFINQIKGEKPCPIESLNSMRKTSNG